MPPQEVAQIGYDALMRGKRVVIAGGLNKVMALSQRFVPEWFTTKIAEAFYTDVKPEDRKREPGEIAAKHDLKT